MRIAPSNFRADPLGWAGNQMGHMGLAGVFSYWVAVIGFMHMGEYPDRWLIFGALAACYLMIELPQGGTLGDTIEDILVVLLYGGGLFIWSMREIEPGISALPFDPVAMLPLMSMITIHFAAGMVIRLWQKHRANRQGGAT
jgi:hypothetical protein